MSTSFLLAQIQSTDFFSETMKIFYLKCKLIPKNNGNFKKRERLYLSIKKLVSVKSASLWNSMSKEVWEALLLDTFSNWSD